MCIPYGVYLVLLQNWIYSTRLGKQEHPARESNLPGILHVHRRTGGLAYHT